MAFNATYTDLSPVISNTIGKVAIETGNQSGLVGAGLGVAVVILTGVAIKNALF